MAEAAGLPVPDLGNLTATALLGWYAWHTVSRTIPHLVKAFREEMGAMRTEFRAERESMHRTLGEERLQRHTDHMAIVEALNALARHFPSIPWRHTEPSSTHSTERNRTDE